MRFADPPGSPSRKEARASVFGKTEARASVFGKTEARESVFGEKEIARFAGALSTAAPRAVPCLCL
jgi:hypothetical protein